MSVSIHRVEYKECNLWGRDQANQLCDVFVGESKDIIVICKDSLPDYFETAEDIEKNWGKNGYVPEGFEKGDLETFKEVTLEMKKALPKLFIKSDADVVDLAIGW